MIFVIVDKVFNKKKSQKNWDFYNGKQGIKNYIFAFFKSSIFYLISLYSISSMLSELLFFVGTAQPLEPQQPVFVIA